MPCPELHRKRAGLGYGPARARQPPTSLQFKKGDRVYALDNTFLGNQQHGSFQVSWVPSGALQPGGCTPPGKSLLGPPARQGNNNQCFVRRLLGPEQGLASVSSLAWPHYTNMLCLQEVVSVPEAHVAHAPKNVPLTEAGGIPLVALTAWQVSLPMPAAVQAEAQTGSPRTPCSRQQLLSLQLWCMGPPPPVGRLQQSAEQAVLLQMLWPSITLTGSLQSAAPACRV